MSLLKGDQRNLWSHHQVEILLSRLRLLFFLFCRGLMLQFLRRFVLEERSLVFEYAQEGFPLVRQNYVFDVDARVDLLDRMNIAHAEVLAL